MSPPPCPPSAFQGSISRAGPRMGIIRREMPPSWIPPEQPASWMRKMGKRYCGTRETTWDIRTRTWRNASSSRAWLLLAARLPPCRFIYIHMSSWVAVFALCANIAGNSAERPRRGRRENAPTRNHLPQKMHRSFDSASAFAGESACCAQDDSDLAKS